jgi:hypothetical protein
VQPRASRTSRLQRPLPAGPALRHGRLHPSASTAASHHLLLPRDEPILERDLRRHRLPGAGDADRGGDRRLHHGRGGHAPQGDGQEEAGGHDREKEKFVDGAAARKGHPRDKASELWNQIEPFAGYGFNKSHSVAYATSPTRPPTSRPTTRRLHGRHADLRDGVLRRRRQVRRECARWASRCCRRTSTRAATTSPSPATRSASGSGRSRASARRGRGRS